MKRRLSLICLATLLLLVLVFPKGLAAEKTLTYWTFLSPTDTAPRSVVQTKLIEQFQKENPGVKIDVSVMPWSELNPKVIQAVGAGKGPDVTRIASDSFEQQFAANTFLPLDEFVAREGEDFKADWVFPWASYGTYKGHKMILPIEHRVVSLLYRKDLLDSVGAGVPRTWDELGKAAAALTAKGYVGFVVGLGFGGAGNGFVEWFKPAIWAAGGDLLDKNGKAAFNGPAGRKAMQTLYDLVYTYKAIPQEALAWDVDGQFQGLQAGRVAMELFATHRVTTARVSPGIGDNLQVAPVPGYTVGKPAPGHTTGWTLAMTKDCKDKELAWKFMKFMTSTEAQVMNAKIAGELPARLSAYKDPWFQTDPLGKEMTRWAAYIKDYGRSPQFPEDYLFLHRVLVEAAQRIILNREPIDQVLDQAAEKYDKKIGA